MPNETEFIEVSRAVGQFSSEIFTVMFPTMAVITAIPIVVWIARGLWQVVKWALRWLVYLLKDERKKKKEEYTAHYDALLGIEPTRWQLFKDRLLPLLEYLINEPSIESEAR